MTPLLWEDAQHEIKNEDEKTYQPPKNEVECTFSSQHSSLVLNHIKSISRCYKL